MEEVYNTSGKHWKEWEQERTSDGMELLLNNHLLQAADKLADIDIINTMNVYQQWLGLLR